MKILFSVRLLLCTWLGSMAALIVQDAALASGKITYGSQAGMQVTVVSIRGLDTANAVIRTSHTREDAIEFCRDYVGEVTECIQNELAVPLNDQIHANCLSGLFTDFYGDAYRFEGKNPAWKKQGAAKYRVRNMRTGEIASASMASGYFVNLGIFKALCPGTALEPEWVE